jgi:formylglycine-generating enzyme required for sulfatase activity/serine/threonine protein kinase
MDRQREQRYAEAAAFLGEILERVEAGTSSFEACCAERPHLVEELKELYAACHRLQSSDATRQSGAIEAEQFSSALLGRLAGRKAGFERYELRGEIARGGQGTVVQVWDDDLRRHLAMKVLVGKSGDSSSTGSRSVSPRALARFLEEAQVTGQLDHPGIVPIHELGLDDEGRVYFTMKLVKGRTLKDVFQLAADGQEGWTRTRALSVLLKVCEAMAYAHHKGVVHRDLKPANVMVGRFGEVYVMDWGLARVLGREDRANVEIAPEMVTAELRSERENAHASEIVTKDGHVVGTPAYMSPEQALGRLDEIGPHSDVYSVGAMLYHLLAGHTPYVKPGTSPSNYSIWYSVQERPPDPLRERAPDAPAELVAICEKAMAREIGARYRDMGALGEDLMAFLEHRAVKAYQTGAVVELRKWVERNRGLAAASAAGLLVLVVGLVTTLVLKAQSDHNAALAAHNAELARENAAESARNAEEARRQAAAAGQSEAEARREKERAEKNEQRALASEHRANEQTLELLRLSALQDLDDLDRVARGLWPAHPEWILRYEEWLMQAQALIDELPAHEAKLAELETRARPASAAGLAAGSALEFASSEDRWWHAQLAKLVDGLNALTNPDTGLLSGVSPEHGWGVRRRLEFARTVEERTLSGAEARARWAEAIASIRDPERSPAYGGLVLAPQIGLLPIGQDPQSGLWEFAHVQSGEPAERGPDGKLVIEDRTGIVLVLLPGGRFWMGAQSTSPAGQNYDALAMPVESLVHEVTLAPFFLSKYEMTQAQWERSTGTNPSLFGPATQPAQGRPGKPVRPTNPVERVSWHLCQQTLERLDLALPTEAQWEYGARGGTSTVWWTGDEARFLAGAANIADVFFKTNGGEYVATWPHEEWLDDGYVVHAPVGSFAPNAFGLHDVHGNVDEWCRDLFVSYEVKIRFTDGERAMVAAPGETDKRAIRGGDWNNLSSPARSAARFGNTPDSRPSTYGVRPVRGILGL